MSDPLDPPSPDLSHLPVPPSTVVYVQTPTACMHCGYSLQGLPINGACPECGVPIRQSAGPWATVDDLPHMPMPVYISTPTTCVQCGYSLVGLRRDAACPECATPIARSLRPALLREKPIAFIKRTRAGVAWLFHSVMLFIFSVMFITAMEILSSAVLIVRSLFESVMLPILGVVMLISWIAWIGGWWRLSTPDTSLVRPRTGVAMALRFLCWVQIAGLPFAAIAALFAAGHRRYDLPAGVAYAAALIASLVCLPVGAYRLRQLATLIPDLNLEVKMTTLYRVIVICVVMTLSSLPFGAIAIVLGMAIFCLASIGWFGFLIAFPMCLASFRRAVDEELRHHVPQSR